MRRRSLAVLAALVMVLSIGLSAAAEPAPVSSSDVVKGDYDSYVVIMKADPLVVTEGQQLDTKKAKARGAQLKASHSQAMRDAGLGANKILNEYTVALNGFSARVSYRQAVELAADKNVAMVLPDELLQRTTDASGDFLGLSGPSSAYSTGVTGKGVVVGVIDDGIWPEHPSFADNGLPAPTGINGPIPCEFGNTAHNPNDAAFTCQDKLVGARQMLATYRALVGAAPDEFDSARDDNGHGTHTASTAAGNAGVQAYVYGSPVGDGTISGIAPDAHIIAYKGLGNLGGFTSDLAAAIDQAVADGVDVINYSIGGGGGTIGADDLAFLFANDAGVFVASSAGNSGPGAKTVGSPGDNPWLMTVGASTQRRFLAGTVELGNGATYVGASITDDSGGVFPLVDGATLGNEFCRSVLPFSSSVTGKIVLCKRGGNARVDKSLAVLNAGGVGLIHYEASDQGNLFTDTHWVPTVHIDNTPGLAVKAYIAANPGTATAEIRDTRSVDTWPYAPSMTQFSSRGPNNYGDVIKPDITAPGLQILAGNSPFPDAGSVTGELFQAIAGTSMSSPQVAGLLALLKQANPSWSASAAKSALMTTAYQAVLDNDRTSPADPFDMGSGHANPGRAVHKGSAFQPGLVYDAGLLDYLGWACDAYPAIFGNAAATCASLAGMGIPTDASDLNYPSIAVAQLAGSQTVTRTVTSVARESGWRTYNVSVAAPNGYTVTVSPSQIRLKRGQSATFEVTIVNNSAPIGAWRFGSLTWTETSGLYSVRSPIAANASQFNAPSLVQESGESGSGSVDVLFGYSGDYEATAHGLVPATVTSDNVLQDADQTFAPGDVGTGGANAHTFNLSGAAVFRIAMPPEATEADADLDIFVYNPSNVQVASSTAGGTDELITISNPANGTWTVYVHGWAAPGGDSDYDLFTWAIPAAPDAGSLVIDSEPANATIGTVGAIEYSWTGATTGQWHFGAISHVGPGSTVMGRTLIEVDNR